MGEIAKNLNKHIQLTNKKDMNGGAFIEIVIKSLRTEADEWESKLKECKEEHSCSH